MQVHITNLDNLTNVDTCSTMLFRAAGIAIMTNQSTTLG